jgi:tetratricopeptide (TPR) repeat protein
MLYELLTRHVPVDPRESGEAAFLQQLAAGELDQPRPSARVTAVRLPADLDAIVMKALSAERARRYDTAASLAEDLSRHLRDEPVVARPPTTSYRMRKFVRRNRVAVVATGITVLALLTALGVSVYQTRVAVHERDRAERRFADLRQLANALIFKIHDSVRALPGSTEARRAIVAEALTYLERLSADETDDPALQHELARGYLRVGTVQGRPTVQNLGDREGALKSLGKAIAVLEPLVARPDAASPVARDLVEARVAFADVQRIMGERGAALSTLRSAVVAAEQLVAREPDPENRLALGSALFQQALVVPPTESLPLWTRTLEVFEGLLSEAPDDPGRQRNVALVHKQIGAYHAGRLDAEAARRHHSRALELDERRLAAAPNHAGAMFDVAIDLSNLALEASKSRDYAEAVRLYRRSLVLRQRLVEADPRDVQAKSRLAYVHTMLSNTYRSSGQPGLAVSHARRAVAISEPLAAVDAFQKVELAQSLVALGEALGAYGREGDGCAAFARAGRVVRELRDARVDANSERRALIEKRLPDLIRGCQ